MVVDGVVDGSGELGNQLCIRVILLLLGRTQCGVRQGRGKAASMADVIAFAITV